MTTTVLAQTSAQPGTGFDPMTLILLAAFAFLIFTMFRGRKKARTQQEQLKSSLAPGAEVMTQFGLYGTVVSIDSEENKIVLELSPGNTATVHTQAVAKVVEPTAPAAPAAVPDAGTAPEDPADPYRAETPEETLRRLEGNDGKDTTKE